MENNISKLKHIIQGGAEVMHSFLNRIISRNLIIKKVQLFHIKGIVMQVCNFVHQFN